MLRATAVLLVMVSSAFTLRAQYTAQPVQSFSLPADARFPEGIAFSQATQMFYTANAETGAVVEISRKGDVSRVVVPPGVLAPKGTATFPVALGMKVDGANRLWIAGGRTGRMSVVDIKSGKLLKQVVAPTPGASLINDVVVVGNAGDFTDSTAPTLWRLAAQGTQFGELEAWTTFADTPIQYSAGINLNGITVAPDGQSFIVVQMDKGLLFRIDIASKAIRAIDTTGINLTGGDGLVASGDMLYVVRQPASEIVALQLQPDPPLAKQVGTFRDPALAWPATALLLEKSLVVVNSQFNTRATKNAREPFTFAMVPLSRLSPPAPR
jgi:sugar lactone lactonase YvrE